MQSSCLLLQARWNRENLPSVNMLTVKNHGRNTSVSLSGHFVPLPLCTTITRLYTHLVPFQGTKWLWTLRTLDTLYLLTRHFLPSHETLPTFVLIWDFCLWLFCVVIRWLWDNKKQIKSVVTILLGPRSHFDNCVICKKYWRKMFSLRYKILISHKKWHSHIFKQKLQFIRPKYY